MIKLLITGGAGYIGSHTANLLSLFGYDVTVLDNLSTGFVDSLHDGVQFVRGDILDETFLDKFFGHNTFDALIHFAAKLVVPESILRPDLYYKNNVVGSLNLFTRCKQAGIKHIIFSSTAAVYGKSQGGPVSEEDSLCNPINPYGQSKYLVERVLRDICNAYNLNAVILRYFNVAGASVDGKNGQKTKDATHLIKVAAEAACGKRSEVQVYGTDYNTADGTCIRDYIHVSDLAAAHEAALRYLLDGGISRIFNCGYGKGFSVYEVLNTMQKVSGSHFKVIPAQRRVGDPEMLIADNSRILRELIWRPQYNDLDLICKTAYDWESKMVN